MFWVVQNGLHNEPAYQDFIAALKHMELEHIVVKPIPFTDIMLPGNFDSMVDDQDNTPEPNIPTDKQVIAFGTITLSRIAQRRGWNPGTYLNENFDYEVWSREFGRNNLLNNGPICALRYLILLKDAARTHGGLFVRPTADDKCFTGQVVSYEEFDSWHERMCQEEGPVTGDTPVMFSEPRKIYSEWRLFVVDGKIVTGSQYKRGDQLYIGELDDPIIDFGQRMIDKWQPHDAFTLDIADTPEGRKIIEIGNICSAGFYAADPQKIIARLEALEW